MEEKKEVITEKSMEVADDKLKQVVGGYAELRPGESYCVDLFCHACCNRFWVYDLTVPKATAVCPCCGTETSIVYDVTTCFG